FHPTLPRPSTTRLFPYTTLFRSHQLDIGIVEGHFKDAQLITEPFAEDSMVIVASPEHELVCREEQVAIGDLEKETWIVREHGSGDRKSTRLNSSHVSISYAVFCW